MSIRLIVAGPAGSGTNALFEAIRTNMGITDMRHASMPEGEEWWDWRDYPGYRFVVIVRRPDVTTLALTHRTHQGKPLVGSHAEAIEWWDRAIGLLATIPDAYWVFYSALVADPQTQLDNIARWLGVGEWTWERNHWRDEDRKWYPAIGLAP